ncbi:toll/interleukin-1 receptor domain-containing protein [Bradyrhizobium ontarionense]|uniref:Toll/interleukin-1 receptor domain-containing protein n=1 Tax=Bradyrhizobium ontarionense TaxID=2898149 RepID=A0ABY3RLE0_9BRAD|nr:toll/interleukin-1 receptor domain-containing protein [Bradyrhizobium sp. A19]UFZ07613.1 toll/interleukin-1 receptor domain-containing protein [Bradyrhizobium sp. A19]
MSIEPMRVYVLWAPARPDPSEDPGGRLADTLHRQLDALGMMRDGIGFRIPVRKRSANWRDTGRPQPIDWAAARSNIVILVIDDVMRNREGEWGDYVADIERHIRDSSVADMLLPVITSRGQGVSAFDALATQGIVAPAPQAEQGWERWTRRITMYVMGAVWAHQRNVQRAMNRTMIEQSATGQATSAEELRRIGIFLSHAKMDGEGVALLLERFRDSRPNPTPDEVRVNSVEMFFDASDTVAGGAYAKQFEQAIKRGALLGILTDAYHGRPWCMWELLTAKKFGSPIVLWDLSHRGTLRSFPYLGNVPVIRTPDVRYQPDGGMERLDVTSISDADIEHVLLALLSEAMRMEVWAADAQDRVNSHPAPGGEIVVCARPPELAELVHHCMHGPIRLVYPDPPICLHEKELIETAFPQVSLIALSELSS